MGGLVMHMGGIGARAVKDYSTLSRFVQQPWRFRISDPEHPECCQDPELEKSVQLHRTEPEAERKERKRADTWTSSHRKSTSSEPNSGTTASTDPVCQNDTRGVPDDIQ